VGDGDLQMPTYFSTETTARRSEYRWHHIPDKGFPLFSVQEHTLLEMVRTWTAIFEMTKKTRHVQHYN
jgi:hypothetical protein